MNPKICPIVLQTHISWVKLYAEGPQYVKHLSQIVATINVGPAFDYDVININLHSLSNEELEQLVDKALIGCSCIF